MELHSFPHAFIIGKIQGLRNATVVEIFLDFPIQSGSLGFFDNSDWLHIKTSFSFKSAGLSCLILVFKFRLESHL